MPQTKDGAWILDDSDVENPPAYEKMAEARKKKAIEVEEQKEVQPSVGEYQGKPILRIPTVASPNPDTTWHWMSFGKNKAKAIVKYFDAIKKFAEE